MTCTFTDKLVYLRNRDSSVAIAVYYTHACVSNIENDKYFERKIIMLNDDKFWN